MGSSLDRLVSIISYITFGMFSLVWLIYANFTKKRISPFLAFNLYQAIFVSICLAVFSLIYSIAINLLSVIPFIGDLIKGLDIFLNQTPIYFSTTITGFFVLLILIYLCLMSFLGKKPYIPVVSDIVNSNFGG